MSVPDSSPPPGRPAPWQSTGSIQEFLRSLWQYAAFRLIVFALVGVLALQFGGWLLGHLASVIVTVLGAYALARQLGSGRIGAAVAGVSYTYAPWLLAQAGHLHILSNGGIPLALAMLAWAWRLRYSAT